MKTMNIASGLLLVLPQASQAWVAPPTPISTPATATRTYTDLSMSKQGPGGGRQSKKIVDDMMDFMNEPVSSNESVDQSFVPDGPPTDDDLAPFIRTIAKAADMRKADNIVAMRISKVTTVANFVVVCSGNSRPQNQAIAGAIQDDVLEAFGNEHDLLGNGVPEGTADSGWILLDFGDVMVHVMTPKSRLFYDIEGQWREKGGEYMNLDDVLLPNSGASLEAPKVGGAMTGISEEDDPFWS
eukprot:CAMPEP_0197232706 /NCGR_PEP_ID=MMETSP1429-20130617/945_1 /TAXON_ID=49237 /ORGANISM="Chaetoceros  sp., Strain UNC1202" /LENGTH=240 /DNA_ID=CAMNT_0042690807 /DNA_START=102 /DNA_END=824 /DNA_ORIENTATION=-